MKTIAMKMQLYPEQKDEYLERHNELWPELKSLLKGAGIEDYYIFHDATTNALFAILTTDNPEALNELPKHPIMQQWWKYMADIMETNEDYSPVTIPLEMVFFMP